MALISRPIDNAPNYAAVSVTGAATHDLLAAVASRRFRVHAMYLRIAGATNIYFRDDVPTTIFGGAANPITFAGAADFVLPYNELGWFETSTKNQKLQLVSSGAVVIAGGFVYQLIDRT